MIILICGKSMSGKTTLADFIYSKYNFLIYNLADLLKQLIFKILKFFNIDINSIDDLYQYHVKEQYREYLQYIGTEIFREIFGENFWCEQLYKKIKNNNNKSICIADIRFQNEIDYFKNKFKNECISILLIRNDSQNDIKQIHISEKCNLKTDYIYINRGTKNDLYKYIDDILYVKSNIDNLLL